MTEPATTIRVPLERSVRTTRTQRIWLGDDLIVRGVFLPGVHVTASDATENVACVKTLGRLPLRMMIDLSGVQSVDRSARAYLSGPETAEILSAAALLGASRVARMIANFFLGFNKPLFPIRMVESEAEAVAWLEAGVR